MLWKSFWLISVLWARYSGDLEVWKEVREKVEYAQFIKYKYVNCK